MLNLIFIFAVSSLIHIFTDLKREKHLRSHVEVIPGRWILNVFVPYFSVRTEKSMYKSGCLYFYGAAHNQPNNFESNK